METWLQVILTIIGSVAASSGFWAYIQAHGKKKDASTTLLIGMAHDRIIFLGMGYIRRGWLTQDEYNNLHDYLYVPYEKLGGNGTAKRVMNEVKKLEIRDSFGFILEEMEEEKQREASESNVGKGCGCSRN